MENVSIALITDDNYIVPTIVTITSLQINKKETTLYDIYVIGCNLSDENKTTLGKIGTNVIDSKILLPEFENSHPHVSVAALSKFNLPNIFEMLDKILYLDTDMIILKDLSELFQIDLKEHYAAVVKDMAGTIFEHCNKQIRHKHYFNSGMMLLNLKKMRKDKIFEKLVDYKIHQDRGHFMDQDCLNAVLSENVIYVSPVYNWMAPNQTDFSEDEIKNFYDLSQNLNSKNAAIVHLTNQRKPWDYTDVWGYKLWHSYYKKSILKHIKRHYKNKIFGWEKSQDCKILRFLRIPVIKIRKTPMKKEVYILKLRIKAENALPRIR